MVVLEEVKPGVGMMLWVVVELVVGMSGVVGLLLLVTGFDVKIRPWEYLGCYPHRAGLEEVGGCGVRRQRTYSHFPLTLQNADDSSTTDEKPM